MDATQHLACVDAASQQRGPHPLPIFLELAVRTVGEDPLRLAAVLRGIRAYQEHPYRRSLAEPPVLATVGHARLLDYGGAGPPVVFVPSIINPSDVLDLMEGRSMLRWLSANGLRPLLLDWGSPKAGDAAMSIDEHVTERLLPLLDAVGEPSRIVGYCLGGTMALASAQLSRTSKVALIATPWRFSGCEDERRAGLGTLWRHLSPLADAAGLIPMDMLQPGFWELNGARSITKYELFGAQEQASPSAELFVALEDWANGGPPITAAAASQLLDRFFCKDEPGNDQWRIGGETIAPDRLKVPVLSFGASRDRLVPLAATATVGERRDLDGGHVGIIIGKTAKQILWKPLRDWLLA